tara:strand:- start:591 stop:845 length:255 start_codon:yes stop_codon:yes gene_type:complete
MSQSNKPFGYSMRECFNVGDLVQWKIYRVDGKTNDVDPNSMHGIITKIFRQHFGGRTVWVAQIFEATTAKYFEVNLLTLTLLKD